MTAPAYNVYAIQFAFAAFRKLTSLEEAGRYREAVRAAVLAYLAHLPASEALALSARPAAGSETREALAWWDGEGEAAVFGIIKGYAEKGFTAKHVASYACDDIRAALAAVPPSPDATTGTE